MNRAELVDEIAKITGLTKVSVQNTILAMLHNLTATLAKGERATLVGFGTFERRHRKSRIGVNPQNPQQKIKIEAARVPAFRAGRELKNIVDGRAKLPGLPKSIMSPTKSSKAGKTHLSSKTAPAKKGGKRRR